MIAKPFQTTTDHSRCTSNDVTLDVAFLNGPNGRLFTYSARPRSKSPPAASLLIPPFAEEMNRSRQFMAVLARSLAGIGIQVTVADLFGTGDSAGDFADARWSLWQEDVAFLADRLKDQYPCPLWLGGIRTGALLAASAMQQQEDSIPGCLFIQPVKSGAQFLTQFLRIRIAAAMSQGKKETVAELRSALQNGDEVFVGGYHLHPDLALPLDQTKLSSARVPEDLAIDWFEAGTVPKSAESIQAGIPQNWQTSQLYASYCECEPFWNMQEPVTPHRLISAITKRLRQRMENA